MSGKNFVYLEGKLVRDAEQRESQGTGNVGVSFTICVEKQNKIGGEWKSYPMYFDCIYWGVDAEKKSVAMKKGQAISVTGELNQVSWEKDGKRVYKIQVEVSSLNMLMYYIGGISGTALDKSVPITKEESEESEL